MHIFDLPLELLDLILHHSIVVRGLPRALRLKLVCKSFQAAVGRILFHTKVLDDVKWGHAFRSWNERRHHGADTLWHDYLVFRCRDKTDSSVPCYVEIRSVVDALVQWQNTNNRQEKTQDWDEVLDKLCWLALECPMIGGNTWQGWNGVRKDGPRNLGLSTLSAATYLGYAPLVRDLLAQPGAPEPTQDDDLFPSPMYIAARTGQADMLQLLQEHLPQFEQFDPYIPSAWRSKLGPGSLTGAASRGDMDMVRLCLYPPSRIINPENGDDDTTILGHSPRSLPGSTHLSVYMLWATWRARSPEVYRYLQSLLSPFGYMSSMHLATMAGVGDIPMVRFLIEEVGADPSDTRTAGGTPLAHAVRACNDDVVDLLLQKYHADPNERGAYRLGTTLTAAARAGSMVMLRKLLDGGYRPVIDQPKGGDNHTLRCAVKLEHTAMVELLLDLGVGSEGGRVRAMKLADGMGLESMVELLSSRAPDDEGCAGIADVMTLYGDLSLI
ncbi:ankyrin repeat-containing domain protein [Apodospora peruviana]|uniref:Ankyrin repeat-containing domain protein n=1 Tax=Apodospora peruviana TaxID=516989 RepID=A0AAE0MA81_9PEZI|nr:ankyrin repeat-containing domain protein [Apodospora peruviana]